MFLEFKDFFNCDFEKLRIFVKNLEQ